jgi:hypothetical protein
MWLLLLVLLQLSPSLLVLLLLQSLLLLLPFIAVTVTVLTAAVVVVDVRSPFYNVHADGHEVVLIVMSFVCVARMLSALVAACVHTNDDATVELVLSRECAKRTSCPPFWR